MLQMSQATSAPKLLQTENFTCACIERSLSMHASIVAGRPLRMCSDRLSASVVVLQSPLCEVLSELLLGRALPGPADNARRGALETGDVRWRLGGLSGSSIGWLDGENSGRITGWTAASEGRCQTASWDDDRRRASLDLSVGHLQFGFEDWSPSATMFRWGLMRLQSATLNIPIISMPNLKAHTSTH